MEVIEGARHVTIYGVVGILDLFFEYIKRRQAGAREIIRLGFCFVFLSFQELI